MAKNLVRSLDNPFWQFSLSVYQDEKVKEACLQFQNSEGINVNLLLLCCWLSYAVDTISELEFKEACYSIANWQQNITQPIRKIRQHLKTLQENGWIGDFYQQILDDELSSESYQQYCLYRFFADKLKEEVSENEELMLYYLYRFFDEMKLVINSELDSRIKHFAKLILAKLG